MKKTSMVAFIAILLSASAMSNAALACGGPLDVACNVGKTLEKGAQDAGHGLENGTHDVGHTLENGVHDVGHTIEKAAQDSAKAVGDAATVAWQAIARPFVEIVKFLRDPLAGLRNYAHDFYEKAVVDFTALAYLIVKWLSIGFGVAVAFASGVAVTVASLFFRRKQPKVNPAKKFRHRLAV